VVGTPTDSPHPLVSVILPTLGREKELRDTLAALLSQPYPRFEVVVVDQTPVHEPETERYIASAGERLRYFRTSKPGYSRSINFAAQQARGDLLLLLDDDIVPAADLIGDHVRAFDDPSVGAVAGRVIDSLGFVIEDVPAGRLKRTGEIVPSFSGTRPAEAECVPGGNVSVRREVFDEIGGFPSDYIGTETFSDSDLGVRVRKAGYRIRFVPSAEIFHLRAPSGGCANRISGFRREYSFQHNATLFALKYLPPTGLLLSLALRGWQAPGRAWKQRQPWQLVLPLVSAPHAVITAAVLALRRWRADGTT
jgi:GT2 family glycosyltransferase